ncbi:MAG: amine oxidase [Anaeromyxobacter sp. RBG_16_69_14]|nr:MAG: amine oxidase [Anaeromyxobacter sp. RBG_16_69_14]
MDRQRVREREAQCIQDQPPACTATCPVHVDVRGMIGKVQDGDFAGAFAVFRQTIPFPGVVARICDHPCQPACKRVEAGEAIEIGALERACALSLGAKAAAVKLRPAAKKSKRVAVVGGGLSGLTAAFDLAMKGFQVVIFEEGDRLGGRLRSYPEEVLPGPVVDADLELLRSLGVEVNLGSPVGQGDGARVSFDSLLEGFDAVYLGTGPLSEKVAALGLAPGEGQGIAIDPFTFATSHGKVFAGGGLRQGSAYSPISSLQDGRYAALSIDRMVQKVSLTGSREKQGPFATRLYTRVEGTEPRPAVRPADPAGYTPVEAVEEARRCLLCECMECVKACEYLAHYGSYPKRYVREIATNADLRMGSHTANRMVNSCALCGLCEAVCPEKLSMGEVCREAREEMVGKKMMPPSTHDFALRDMAFSRGEHFALARHAPGFEASSAVFFPGCQLAASSPEHVARVYGHLREAIPGGVGLHLGCCGAPADWAGQRQLFSEALGETVATWAGMGNPRVITACSSCYRAFKAHLPEAQVESLWTVLAEVGLPGGCSPAPARAFAIHDPCATREDASVQDGARRVLAQLGVPTLELGLTRGLTTCCGYGGLMSFANKEVADKVVKRRIGESEADYVAYCAMCRDNFAARGKRSVHLLDLVYGAPGTDPAARKGPTFSQRHENRARLKRRLLAEVWGEQVTDERRPMNLIISPEVTQLMEERMILAEDVEKVIGHAEATGDKIEDKESGHLLASHRPVSVTYWVEYSVEPSGFVVHNAYSHRMEIS